MANTRTDQAYLGMDATVVALAAEASRPRKRVGDLVGQQPFSRETILSGIAEALISNLIAKGVDRIASRKTLTSQDLTVLLLHEQSKSISRMEKEMEGIDGELMALRTELVPLLNQGRDIADIRARIERIEAKVS